MEFCIMGKFFVEKMEYGKDKSGKYGGKSGKWKVKMAMGEWNIML